MVAHGFQCFGKPNYINFIHSGFTSLRIHIKIFQNSEQHRWAWWETRDSSPLLFFSRLWRQSAGLAWTHTHAHIQVKQDIREIKYCVFVFAFAQTNTHRISSTLERMCSAQQHSFSKASLPCSESSLDSSSSARVRPILRFCLHRKHKAQNWYYTASRERPLKPSRPLASVQSETWNLPGSCAGLVAVTPATPGCIVCKAPLGLTPASASLCTEHKTYSTTLI